MDAQRESKIKLGPARPYAVYVVAGVTYTHSAPTVIPVQLSLDAMAFLATDPALLLAGLAIPAAPIVAPVAPTPAAVTVKRRPDKREFLTRAFPFGTFATVVPDMVHRRAAVVSGMIEDANMLIGRSGGTFSKLRRAVRAIDRHNVADLYDTGKLGRLAYEMNRASARALTSVGV